MRSEDNNISYSDVSSYTFNSSSEPRPRQPADSIAEPSSSSPSRRASPPWAEVPVSYVPNNWPTGPRELPEGHYICPFEGCKTPVGPTELGQGYSRATLGAHLFSHGGFDGLHSLRRDIRWRVVFLRQALRHEKDDEESESYHSSDESDEDDLLQRQTSAIVLDLEEIRAWELSYRHMRPSGPAQEARGARELSNAPSAPYDVSEWLRATSTPEESHTGGGPPASEAMYMGRGTPPGVDYRALFSDQDLYPQLNGEVLKASQRAQAKYFKDGADEESPRLQDSERPQDDRSFLSTTLFSGSVGVHPSFEHEETGIPNTIETTYDTPTKKARTSGPQLEGFDEDTNQGGDADSEGID